MQPLLTVQRHLIAGSTARQPQSRKYDAVRRPGLPGYDVATLQGIAEGDSLTLLGEPFSVVAVLPETGTVDDSRIFGHLHTVQRLSGKGDVVNCIEVVGCCPGPANLYAPFGWADLPIPPPERVAKNRWTRTGMMKKVYVVRLPEEERQQLEGMVKGGKTKGRKVSALKLTRARILLKADQQESAPSCTDAEIADALDISPKTVFNVRRRWVELGLEQALERKKQNTPSRQRKLDGHAAAKLVAVCCDPAPEGQVAWTLRLLADKVVELGLATSISPKTVRQTLKKTTSNLG